jgi:hypothetical protein
MCPPTCVPDNSWLGSPGEAERNPPETVNSA